MSDSAEMRQRFAVAFLNHAGNATRAAIEAGYSPSCARVLGSRLARNPQVQQLIRQEQQRMLGGRLASMALGVLESIMLDPAAPAGARVDAAKTLLDRAGLTAIPAGQWRDATGIAELREISPEDLQQLLSESKARLAQLQTSTAATSAPVKPLPH